MKLSTPFFVFGFLLIITSSHSISGRISKNFTLDSLGACQGISHQNDKFYLYGDREVGVMREYILNEDSLIYQHKEYRFTIKNKNVIKHPTGLAYHKGMPTFIGNSVRQNAEGSLWKAIIYNINWKGFLKTRTLDGNLINTIEDDACIQGTRPEYIQYKGKWFVATADYGNKNNEVRLYDPNVLARVNKTSDKNVLFKKFTCSPWVQNLHWIANQGILVLIQNQIEGKKWRLTFLDLEKSLETGHESTLKIVDTDKADELEGFTLTDAQEKGIAVSSSRKSNVSIMNFEWDK
ncbi:hypothetical protein [Pedobacter paludis]|uniref:Glutamine cyclotransferase n=1 Tax=Pedobacter paludis TaxID=2203212 RepID=A0A317F1U0_9SPHI|nr:hypothetical protein [Pedobacter paludis]PWS33144.1 hypothetical protein DF947_00445 [Pedobacter paludis]